MYFYENMDFSDIIRATIDAAAVFGTPSNYLPSICGAWNVLGASTCEIDENLGIEQYGLSFNSTNNGDYHISHTIIIDSLQVLTVNGDASFFLLFLMLKLYRVKAIVLERVEKMVTSETYKLIIISPNEKPQLIDFNNIAYFLFENGEIVVILKSGEKKFKSGSLSDIEKMIPSELWVRVNRQTLVMRDSIVRYTPTAICVAINGKEVSIPYYFTKQDEMISLLKAWNSELYSPDDSREEKPADVGQPLSDDLKRLLDYLADHPDASVQQVAKDLYLSTRTAQRRMTELRQLGLLNSSKRG